MKKKFETVQDVLDLMADAPEDLVAHYEGLRGPRKRGSTSAIGLEDMATVELIDITTQVGGLGLAQKDCIYLWGQHKDLDGRVQAMPLRKLMKVHEEACMGVEPFEVELRDAGKHGVDHVYTMHKDWADTFMPRTDVFVVVVGLHKDKPAVFTWHPGPIMSDGSMEFTMDSVIKLEVLK